MSRATVVLMTVLLAASASAARATGAPANPANDYPTAVRADYVFACMNTNGGTQEALTRCACAIDVIASILPFDGYEKAETVLRMRRLPGGGYLAQEFRVLASSNLIRDLQEAQAEADVRCF